VHTLWESTDWDIRELFYHFDTCGLVSPVIVVEVPAAGHDDSRMGRVRAESVGKAIQIAMPVQVAKIHVSDVDFEMLPV
jgi:hypothetical protein